MSKRNNRNKDIIIAGGIIIPLSERKEFLKIADKYWIIDMCPNLKCKFDSPIIILFSFKIFMNGKWYNPASGLLTLFKIINIEDKLEMSNILKKVFFW